jgi:hypothetical protein
VKYRTLGKTGEIVSVLGFGCMRFPTGENGKIERKEAKKMIQYAVENGINYYDTAYPYHKGESEPFVGEVLENGLREKVLLATKYPSWLTKKYDDFNYFLDEQLKRLKTDYFDFYLIHSINRNFWKTMKENGLFKFLENLKRDGRVKHIGFSFHDDLDLYKEIVDSFDWEFSQIMYNYFDTDFQAGQEGLKYAYDKGMGIVIMEPLRGGKLVNNIPEDINGEWNEAKVKRTPVEWALKWLWEDPRISIVLSGMSSMEQLRENVEIANSAEKGELTVEELKLINKVRELYKSKIQVPCTDCKYCIPCPSGVNIPECFTQYNNAFIFNDEEGSRKSYMQFIKDENKASNCIQCRLCETKCPQQIIISEELKKVVNLFENRGEKYE